MLFNVAFIFCLFVITPVGATGKGKAVSTEIRIPEPGEIVKVWSGSLGHYVSRRYIPRSLSDSTLLAFYSIQRPTSRNTSRIMTRIPIFWQLL